MNAETPLLEAEFGTPVPPHEHVFADVPLLELGQWAFDARRCEGCGEVLLSHDEEPLATEDAVRNAGAELDELAAFRAREAQSLVIALDRSWPAIALVLALEERPRLVSTAQTDEAISRLLVWLGRDELSTCRSSRSISRRRKPDV